MSEEPERPIARLSPFELWVVRLMLSGLFLRCVVFEPSETVEAVDAARSLLGG